MCGCDGSLLELGVLAAHTGVNKDCIWLACNPSRRTELPGKLCMPDPFKTQVVLVKNENRERVAKAAEALQKIMDNLDTIGPMVACAHLSLAIETLRATLAEPSPNNEEDVHGIDTP